MQINLDIIAERITNDRNVRDLIQSVANLCQKAPLPMPDQSEAWGLYGNCPFCRSSARIVRKAQYPPRQQTRKQSLKRCHPTTRILSD